MEFFRIKNTIDFMSKRKPLILLSLVLMLISLGSLFTRGLNLGIDFAGGTLVEVGYQDTADLNQVRSQLVEAGFHEAVAKCCPPLSTSDTAIDGMPRKRPSIAAATVPEYSTSSPRFAPWLMPEISMSGS